MHDDPPQPYEVGYCRPPVHSRFGHGHKGGPGRPKGSKNLSTIWREEMDETFPVQDENGKIQRHSALRLAIRRVKNSALAGNLPAALKVIEIQSRMEQAEQMRADATVVPDLSDEDYAILGQFFDEERKAQAAAKRAASGDKTPLRRARTKKSAQAKGKGGEGRA